MTNNFGWSTFDYIKRCVDRGWGLPLTSKDWEEVLTESDRHRLLNLEDKRHHGWQAPLSVETDPFRLLRTVEGA